MKRDIIDSLLIGYLSTYLPFWQFDNLIQQMLAAAVLAMLVFMGFAAIKNEPQGDTPKAQPTDR